MRKKALVTGATGQDASYLVELLLTKEYEVYGLMRRSSTDTTDRITGVKSNQHFHLVEGDITDATNMYRLIDSIRPNEVYNLAAMSHVGTSFEQPATTFEIDALGPLHLLEAIRETSPASRFYQASTSELFGDTPEAPQNESTPFRPCSPYAVAKLAAHHLVGLYRRAYGLHASAGILFNHESSRRSEQFVTRKITRYVAALAAALESGRATLSPLGIPVGFPALNLGNLDAKRDWGFAGDYCINLDVPILTTRGWKYYDDVSIGDEVINFDPRTDRLSTDNLRAKHLLPSDGTKVLLRGRGVHLCVTSQHRVYYQHKSKGSKGGWSEWKVASAADLYTMLSDAALRTKYDYRLPHFQDYNRADMDVSDDKLYLTGAILAEGCLSWTRSLDAGGVHLSLSQSTIANERVYAKLKSCMRAEGLEYSCRLRDDGVHEWRFHADSARRILDWFDGPNVHVMPRWLYGVSARQARVVFNALMDCDGCLGSMTYVSKRPLLLADFQTIAHIAGYRTCRPSRRADGTYAINVIVRRKKYAYIQSAELINDDHRLVWCVTTSHGTIVTRDNGCIQISGNCEAMWRMLQQPVPDDYVIATGQTHSVREFLQTAFAMVGLAWEPFVVVREDCKRPADVNLLQGDASKAREKLGWKPKVTFRELVHDMVEADLAIHDLTLDRARNIVTAALPVVRP